MSSEIKYDVFISYSRKDIAIVDSIKRTIDNSGVICWMDLNNIKSGSYNFNKDITDGINNCKIFLFMLSKNSQNSEYATNEIDLAKDKRKRIILVNIDNCSLNDEFKLKYNKWNIINWDDIYQRKKLITELIHWTQNSNPQKEDFIKKTETQPATQYTYVRKGVQKNWGPVILTGFAIIAALTIFISFACNTEYLWGIYGCMILPAILGRLWLYVMDKNNIINVELNDGFLGFIWLSIRVFFIFIIPLAIIIAFNENILDNINEVVACISTSILSLTIGLISGNWFKH